MLLTNSVKLCSYINNIPSLKYWIRIDYMHSSLDSGLNYKTFMHNKLIIISSYYYKLFVT